MAALSLKTPFLPSMAPIRTKSVVTKRLTVLPSKGRVECRKKGLHPEFYEDAKVYCDGQLVMTTSGTQKEYTVDTWSGNHPFYLGQSDEYGDDFFDIDLGEAGEASGADDDDFFQV